VFFTIEASDASSKARACEITTAHGKISTPVFMPVGTAGTVKGVHINELKNDAGAQIILANTYHLYLRPGIDTLQLAQGIHKFNTWDKPVLTDSGGYQVHSLSKIRKITEEGVTFQSHIDGSKHFFSPENVIEIQRKIGADIIMAFDECTPYPCEYKYAENSMHLTHRWLQRCITHFNNSGNLYEYNQFLFPIVQGSVYADLRNASAEFIGALNLEGNAIGGLSVGEPHEEMYAMTEVVCDILPQNKPRYLMGVGTPANILECIALGVDMFDCVIPTRNGRNGMLYTAAGIINIKNKKWENDFSAIDETSNAWVSKNHSKAYLRHLFAAGEMLGPQIASIHNLSFFSWLVTEARNKIIQGGFLKWKNEIAGKLRVRL
jgi:queuine tRNA-ribosyltransferase